MQYKKILLLFILPLLLMVTTVILKDVRGPNWLRRNLDPAYAYLYNGANLAQFKNVGHIDHPGTTLQFFNALVLGAVHAINSQGYPDLASHMVYRPEFFLDITQVALSVVNGLVLFFLGFIMFKRSRSLWWSLWLQLVPFCFMTVLFTGMALIRPEALLLTAGLWSSLLMVQYLHPESVNDMDNGVWHRFRLPILFSLASGFGMATKITFAPLMVIPFVVLPGWKKKAAYVGGTVLSFVLFTLPIAGMYGQFVKWLIRLLIHKGKYGQGDIGVISFSQYMENFFRLLTAHPLFTVVLVAALASVILGGAVTKLRRVSFREKSYKLLAALVLSQVTGVIIAAKYPVDHYLLPVLVLPGITLVAFFYYCRRILTLNALTPKSFTSVFVPVVLGCLVLVNPPGLVMKVVSQLTSMRNKSLAVNEKAREFRRHPDLNGKDAATVYCYSSSAPEFAGKFGNTFSRNQYARLLNVMYPNAVFYRPGTRRFYRFDSHLPLSLADIRAKYHDNILVQGMQRIRIPGPGFKTLYLNSVGEGVFKLAPPSSQQMARWINRISEGVPGRATIVVPKEWIRYGSELQKRFPTGLFDYTRQDKTDLVFMSIVLENPYFVIPDYFFFGNGLKNEFEILVPFPSSEDSRFFLTRMKDDVFRLYVKKFEAQSVAMWPPGGENPGLVPKGLHFFKGYEYFSMVNKRENGRNVVTISPKTAKEMDVECRVGYRANRLGFDMDVPTEGEYVHLVVEADIPPNRVPGANYMVILDYKKKWQHQSALFTGTGPLICTAMKKIRAGSTDLAFGIHFSGNHPGDKLVIKDMKVFVTKWRRPPHLEGH